MKIKEIKEMKTKELYNEVITEFGPRSQRDMCIEECAELINALEKYQRGRNSEAEVITEIADVMIMCEQMMILFGMEKVLAERQYKLRRLYGRLMRHKEIVDKF